VFGDKNVCFFPLSLEFHLFKERKESQHFAPAGFHVPLTQSHPYAKAARFGAVHSARLHTFRVPVSSPAGFGGDISPPGLPGAVRFGDGTCESGVRILPGTVGPTLTPQLAGVCGGRAVGGEGEKAEGFPFTSGL
jgi:hypothetical protein